MCNVIRNEIIGVIDVDLLRIENVMKTKRVKLNWESENDRSQWFRARSSTGRVKTVVKTEQEDERDEHGENDETENRNHEASPPSFRGDAVRWNRAQTTALHRFFFRFLQFLAFSIYLSLFLTLLVCVLYFFCFLFFIILFFVSR